MKLKPTHQQITETGIKTIINKAITSNPLVYGSDASNSLIMLKFLEHYAPEAHPYVTPEIMAGLSTISRQKNMFLLQHPEYDNRVKHKPKVKKLKRQKIDKTPKLFEV